MIYGIDVSSHQPRIDWERVKAGGYEFAFIKATGGTGYRNPEYHRQLAGARGAGLIVGHYHYAFEGEAEGRGPVQEADFFLDYADIQPGDLVALDFEEPEATGNQAPWATSWLVIVTSKLGFKPLFYTYPSYIGERQLGTKALAQWPLWYASYPNTFNPDRWPPVPAQWPTIAIWQYSGGTDIPGIPNDTDANIFDGTRAELLALGKPGLAPAPAGGDEIRTGILDDGRPYVQVVFAGSTARVDGARVADLGIAVESATEPGLLLDQSVQQDTFGGWRERR